MIYMKHNKAEGIIFSDSEQNEEQKTKWCEFIHIYTSAWPVYTSY